MEEHGKILHLTMHYNLNLDLKEEKLPKDFILNSQFTDQEEWGYQTFQRISRHFGTNK